MEGLCSSVNMRGSVRRSPALRAKCQMSNGLHPLCCQPGQNCLGIVGRELLSMLSIPTEDIPAAVSRVLRELGGEGAVETRDEQSHGKPYFKPFRR